MNNSSPFISIRGKRDTEVEGRMDGAGKDGNAFGDSLLLHARATEKNMCVLGRKGNAIYISAG